MESTSDTVGTAESIVAENDAVIANAAEKIKRPVFKNVAERIYFELGAFNIPARMWHKPRQYDNRIPHQGKREMARRVKRGIAQTVFVPKPSHPNVLVRPADLPSRQVLRRQAKKQGIR
jgi:hypothetical protein